MGGLKKNLKKHSIFFLALILWSNWKIFSNYQQKYQFLRSLSFVENHFLAILNFFGTELTKISYLAAMCQFSKTEKVVNHSTLKEPFFVKQFFFKNITRRAGLFHPTVLGHLLKVVHEKMNPKEMVWSVVGRLIK